MRKAIILFRDKAISGLLLLLPLFVVGVVVLKIWYLLHHAVSQLSDQLGWAPITGVIGRVIATSLSFVLICFIAGFCAQWSSVDFFRRWMERRILKFLPGYSYLNAMLRERLGVGSSNNICVLVRLEGALQPGILVERKEHLSVVFIPGVPNPNAGKVCLVAHDRLTQLDMSLSQLHESMEHYGKGLTDGSLKE